MEVCFKFAFALPGTKPLPEVSAEEALQAGVGSIPHGMLQRGATPARASCQRAQNARKMLELFRGATALIDEIDWVRR